MERQGIWRAWAVVATLGWAWTVWSWAEVPADVDATPTRERTAVQPSTASVDPRSRPAPQRAAVGSASRPVLVAPPPPRADVASRAELYAEARQDLIDDLEARHEAHMEDRLDHMLSEVQAFVEDHDVDLDRAFELEAAVLDLHEALRDHRPPSPFEERADDDAAPPGPPHEVFDAFEDRVDEVLGADLADAFRDAMRPPGRGPRR